MSTVFLLGQDDGSDPLWKRCESAIFRAWRLLRSQAPEVEDALIYVRIYDNRMSVQVFDRSVLVLIDPRLNESAFESLKKHGGPLAPSCMRDAMWIIIDNEDDAMHRVATIGWPTELAEGSQALS
jgi:hypothetical protein